MNSPLRAAHPRRVRNGCACGHVMLADMPFVTTAMIQTLIGSTPSSHHPLGAKGVGESATVGAPPAIANAVVGALAHLGVHIDIPITPEKVWNILREKGVAE